MYRVGWLILCGSGQTLSIQASGLLSEDVEEGAKVHLQVKYGLIRIINQEADLCDNVKNVDLECPLKKGPMTLIKDVELPNEIPPVRFFFCFFLLPSCGLGFVILLSSHVPRQNKAIDC